MLRSKSGEICLIFKMSSYLLTIVICLFFHFPKLIFVTFVKKDFLMEIISEGSVRTSRDGHFSELYFILYYIYRNNTDTEFWCIQSLNWTIVKYDIGVYGYRIRAMPGCGSKRPSFFKKSPSCSGFMPMSDWQYSVWDPLNLGDPVRNPPFDISWFVNGPRHTWL